MFLTNSNNVGKKVNTGQLVSPTSYKKVGTTQIQFQMEGKDITWTLPSEATRDIVFTNIGTALAGTAIANT